MFSTIAISRIHPDADSMTGIKPEISQAVARADLRELSWRPIYQLWTYEIENNPTFEEEIPLRVRVMRLKSVTGHPIERGTLRIRQEQNSK